MKSPEELAAKLIRQWGLADVREERLLRTDAWPITLSIGKPSASELTQHTQVVRVHRERWRAVTVGDVDWEDVRFRGGSEPVSVPVTWRLRNAAEWVRAAADPDMTREHETLQTALPQVEPLFRRIIVRQRAWFQEKTAAEIAQASRVAMALSPNYAGGRPLRALAALGTDTKFFERHRRLMVEFLDARYEGRVSGEGLEKFLGALDEGDHWILMAPLAEGLLPFDQQRVRVSELRSAGPPGTHLVVVENESSLHQLPRVPDTVAILGAGLDLEWLTAPWVRSKTLAYWGDIDTWGLTMLARARLHQPFVTPLLMNTETFTTHAKQCAVVEPGPAGALPPQPLTADEEKLYVLLQSSERGRLEQEFLPVQLVAEAFRRWRTEVMPPLKPANP